VHQIAELVAVEDVHPGQLGGLPALKLQDEPLTSFAAPPERLRGVVRRETGYAPTVKTISVRDLRRWPEAEARLEVEKEIVITRDAKPVAKLVRIDERPKPRKRFDPAAHARWQRRIAGGRVSRRVNRAVREAREDQR